MFSFGALRGKAAVVVQGVGVQHQKAGRVVELGRIADGIRVPAQRLVEAEGAVDLRKLLPCHAGHKLIALPEEGRRGAPVHVVIARQHEHGHPRRLHGGKLLRQSFMAGSGPVKADIPRQDQRLRLFLDHLREKGVCNLLAVFRHLAVGVFHHPPEVFPVIGELRRQIVQVRRRDHPIVGIRLLRSAPHQQQAADQHKKHTPNGVLFHTHLPFCSIIR